MSRVGSAKAVEPKAPANAPRTPRKDTLSTPAAASRNTRKGPDSEFLARTAEWEKKRQEKLDEMAREEEKRHQWENPNKRKNKMLKDASFDKRLEEDRKRREAKRQRLLEEELGKCVGKPQISNRSKKIVQKKAPEGDFVVRMRMDEINRKNRMAQRCKEAEPKPKQSLMSKTSRWLMAHQPNKDFLDRVEENARKREDNLKHLESCIHTLREKEYTRVPKISSRSEEIVMARDPDRGDFFSRMQEAELLKKRKLEARQKIMKEARLMEEAAECTFAPQLSHRGSDIHRSNTIFYRPDSAKKNSLRKHAASVPPDDDREMTAEFRENYEEFSSQLSSSPGPSQSSSRQLRRLPEGERTTPLMSNGDGDPRARKNRVHIALPCELEFEDEDELDVVPSGVARTVSRKKSLKPAAIKQIFVWYYKYDVGNMNEIQYMYYNPMTMETVLDVPRTAEIRVVDNPKSQWFEHFDMEKDRVFYSNAVTGKHRLTRPDSLAIALHKWAFQLEDPEYKRTYFFNPITKELTWDTAPPGAEIVVDASRMYYAYPTTTLLEEVATVCYPRICSAPLLYNPVLAESSYSLPEGRSLLHVVNDARYEWWFEHFDENREEYCYFNPITRELIWKEPPIDNVIASLPQSPPHDPHAEHRRYFSYTAGTGREESHEFFYSLHMKTILWQKPSAGKILPAHENDWYEVFINETSELPVYFSPVAHALCAVPPASACCIVLLDGERKAASTLESPAAPHDDSKFEEILESERAGRFKEQAQFQAAVLRNNQQQSALLADLDLSTESTPLEPARRKLGLESELPLPNGDSGVGNDSSTLSAFKYGEKGISPAGPTVIPDVSSSSELVLGPVRHFSLSSSDDGPRIHSSKVRTFLDTSSDDSQRKSNTAHCAEESETVLPFGEVAQPTEDVWKGSQDATPSPIQAVVPQSPGGPETESNRLAPVPGAAPCIESYVSDVSLLSIGDELPGTSGVRTNQWTEPGGRSDLKENSPVDTPTPSIGEYDFEVGMRVDVRGQLGVIRYIGSTHKPGVWIGVEMDDAVGFSNGTVHGVEYFSTRPRHGKFVKPSSVKPLLQS